MVDGVQVLLPTFNGERHLEAMLDSLAGQSTCPSGLLVRDDGSTDRTVSLVEDFAAQGLLPVRLITGGPRLGPYISFMELLTRAEHGQFVALADQDDVWLPDKLARAVRSLEGCNGVAAYGSAVQVTDERLRPMGNPAQGTPSFAHALFETIAPASTLVLNDAARHLIAERKPQRVIYPDLWCYQVCSAVGRFVYDPVVSLLYRQHEGNALGVGATASRRWLRRARRALQEGPGLGPQHWNQLEELRLRYADLLTPEDRGLLDALLHARTSARAGMAYALRGRVERRSSLDALALRATFLLPQPPERG